ncbi:MAG: SDR family oxidoreductase [Pirellulales bacterium]|nr:SDR family oxidoreductase [Pirellulales bacterium]
MPEDFLQLANQAILVMGVANKKSVAWQIAQVLLAAGAKVHYSVRSAARREQLQKLVGDAPIYICDVEHETQIVALRDELRAAEVKLAGLVHSVAFAEYEGGVKPFHLTGKREFLRAMDISCYSLMAVARELQDLLTPDASVVTISISTTKMASENYGYMAPIKAALDSSLAFLAKSFSQFSRVRFNAVAPGLLKTSASAGIPGYLDSYLFAEQATLRKAPVDTREVANTAAFLLSPRSSGINAQRIVVDAGMGVNYFDREIVTRATK